MKIVYTTIKYIKRNFGGIYNEIDIDLKLALDDTREKIKLIESILKGYDSYDPKKVTNDLKFVYLNDCII